MYRTDFWTLWEKASVGCSERIALKQIYYQGWNRSLAQVGCMRQVLRAGALGRPRGMGWRGRWERGSGWGTHVNPWVIHVNVWQKPLQYCKVISLQLIKINEEITKRAASHHDLCCCCCCCCVASVVSNSMRPHRRQPTRLPRPWHFPVKNTEWVAISFSNGWKWKVNVKSVSRVNS